MVGKTPTAAELELDEEVLAVDVDALAGVLVAAWGAGAGKGFFSDHSAGSKSISNHSFVTVLLAVKCFLFSELHLLTFSNDFTNCVFDS